METLEPILAKLPFFAGLDTRYVKLLTGCASNVRYDVGSYLFKENDEATQFFIIRHGRIVIETSLPGHPPARLYTHEEGDVVGWSWLFPPYHWHFSARATELVRAIALDGVCLRGKCEEDPVLGYEFMKRFAHKVIRSLDETRVQLLDLYAAPTGSGR